MCNGKYEFSAYLLLAFCFVICLFIEKLTHKTARKKPRKYPRTMFQIPKLETIIHSTLFSNVIKFFSVKCNRFKNFPLRLLFFVYFHYHSLFLSRSILIFLRYALYPTKTQFNGSVDAFTKGSYYFGSFESIHSIIAELCEQRISIYQNGI